MTQIRRLIYIFLVTLFCLVEAAKAEFDELSSRIDNDIFLEDEGSGWPPGPGSGNGYECDDDEDCLNPKKSDSGSGINTERGGTKNEKKNIEMENIAPPTPFPNGEITKLIEKPSSPASFFSQPGILAAIICGAIVGLLCAILLVMFIVYRMRKKDEGSYVLDDTKRTSTTYHGKSKEFFA